MRWPDFSRRTDADELMDDLSIDGPVLTEALVQLRWINTLLGGNWPTTEGVARLWRAAGRPRTLHVLDVGAGSGDHSRHLLRWADRRGIAMTVTLLDIHPQTCEVAARHYADEPRVTVQQGDLFALPPGVADIITAALVLHHFPDARLGTAVLALQRAARLGVVVNDLHRHPLAWGSIWLLTRLLSRNRMIQHDAPVSVLRGFRRSDLARMKRLPGLERMQARWRPMFRFLLLIPGNTLAGGRHG